jgi:hypothetical protein
MLTWNGFPYYGEVDVGGSVYASGLISAPSNPSGLGIFAMGMLSEFQTDSPFYASVFEE